MPPISSRTNKTMRIIQSVDMAKVCPKAVGVKPGPP